MNAIYLHSVDGFTFLENVPEKPDNEKYGNEMQISLAWHEYKEALAECIEKRLVIGNPEVIGPLLNLQLGEGKFRPWLGTHGKVYQFWAVNEWSTIPQEHYEQLVHKNKNISVREVVILSPPKEEKKPKVFTTFPPEDSEEKENESKKFSTLNSGFSIESKVCDKCGSVLQQKITTGLRIQKVEPVNSSMSEKEKQVKKIYRCRLDEQQCSETCHGNLILKEKCEFCEVELDRLALGEWVTDSPNFWDFANEATTEQGSVSGERKLSRSEQEAYYDGCMRVWTAYVVESYEHIRGLESELQSAGKVINSQDAEINHLKIALNKLKSEPVVSQDQEERFDLEKLQSEYELSIADPGFETFNHWMNRRFKITRNP